MRAEPATRGHWPRGKRRAPKPIPATLRARIDRALERGEYSRCGIARALGISDRTVRRWIAGDDWPTSENLASLQRLLGRRRG